MQPPSAAATLAGPARLWTAALVLALAACGGGGGGGGSSAPPTTTTPTTPTPEIAHGDTSNTLVTSSAGVDYPLRVYLPVGYSTNTATSYPVIYALDGDICSAKWPARWTNWASRPSWSA